MPGLLSDQPGPFDPIMKAFQDYWKRQGLLAKGGLAQAEQGAQQVRGGNVLEGGMNMLMGPTGYLASPITALIPTESEVYNSNLPQWAMPGTAAVMQGAGMMLPGNKKGMGSRKYPVAPRNEWYGDANFEQTGGRIVEMSPDDFLSRARPLKMDDISRDNIDDLKRHMESGRTLDPLQLSKRGEDGRHRAYAAKELGMDTVPVLVWDDAAPEGITAYHGSPHTFDRFDMSKIGSGEGAQAYGHGLYFAENEGVARSYRDALTDHTKSPVIVYGDRYENLGQHSFVNEGGGELEGPARLAARALNARSAPLGWKQFIRRNAKDGAEAIEAMKLLRYKDAKLEDAGSMYQVRLNVKPDELLDWDRPLSEQPKVVQDIAKEHWYGDPSPRITGQDVILNAFTQKGRSAQTEAMKAAGIKGIRYEDAGSRVVIPPGASPGLAGQIAAAAEGRPKTYNYVIFDDKLVDILKRYGIPITAGAGGAAIVSGQDMPDELAAQMGSF